jgi:release factor glutamine methyltransferase
VSSLAPLPARRCRFGELAITYDERVLTPRPWTLVQSRWAAELAAHAPPGPLLELCAGAGQIGLAAAVLCGRDLVQVEASPVAAAYARANADEAGLGDRVEVRATRLQDALHPSELFPLVLADPPYVRSAATERWPDDPPTAIDGGADGLSVTRACLRVAAAHLAPGGQLLLQVAGPRQAQEVAALARGTVLLPGEVRAVDDERAVQLLTRR